MHRMTLNGPWTMVKQGSDVRYEAQVPGTVYKVLLDHGVIEDPFYGENDRKLTALSDDDYSFTRKFSPTDEMLACDHLELEFKGLDTLATIHLNGHLLDRTNNMHRTYRYDVKSYLVMGNNELVIDFASPTKFIEKEQKKDPLWGISTTMDGYEHLRKAHHMFGWDWGPQLPDMGIWRDVTLYAYDQGKIKEVQITQQHHDGMVDVEVVAVNQLHDRHLSIVFTLESPDGTVLEAIHENPATRDQHMFRVENPVLWWPNGYGDQSLYRLKVSMVSDDGAVDEVEKHIGLRTLTVLREGDAYGQTFDITINNERIFAMGADYIPEDVLITRPTHEKTEQLIKDCAKANYNCLRVWGGAYYPSDTFFDLCDRYGLIVWQDFMFACGVYRLTKKFRENITAEFIDNIKRIRHHACLGLWCGNNEMEWAFVEWGLPKDERLRMDYLLMYEKLIPDVLAEHDPGTFYWPASPSSGGGFEDPNADNKGDVHYWKIFHGNEHYKKFREHYFRFASEYGMQALPDMKTIGSYTPEDQMNLFSPVMENHNKCTDPMNGNVKILLNMAQEFKLPAAFEDQVFISQVFQGETIKCAVEHFRRNRGRCMGSTYWQVNDCYPVASWSSIDYYGRWKAMHHMAKRFYAPVLLSAYEEGATVHLHITNDRLTAFEGKVKWQLRHVTQGIVEEGEQSVCVPKLKAQHVADVSAEGHIATYEDERVHYVCYQLIEEEKQLSSETILFVPHKHFSFEEAHIEVETGVSEGRIYVELHSGSYAKAVGLLTDSLEVLFEDNFFDLLPGEDKRVLVDEVRSDVVLTPSALKDDLKVKAVNAIKYGM